MVMSVMEYNKARQGQRYIILYEEVREGLYNMKSEQRPEEENSRQTK